MWFNNPGVKGNQIEDFKVLNMYENIDRNVIFSHFKHGTRHAFSIVATRNVMILTARRRRCINGMHRGFGCRRMYNLYSKLEY